MNITIEAPHMQLTDSIKEYVESKISKLTRLYEGIQSIEVILDVEADSPRVEIIAKARKKHTFVANHRDTDMYAAVDVCTDKVLQQVRRHKDKVRDRQGLTHEQMLNQAQER
ncbi:MAG: ribosome hibernation-promoting factor, HPF/YfiA family [Phycisphaerae bacterium]